MNLIFIFLLILLSTKEFEGKSVDYYKCIDPSNQPKSASDCTNLFLQDSDGYKCCSMKIEYDSQVSYNCFPIENQYLENKEVFNEYFSNRNLAFLFGDTGGQTEINCGYDMQLNSVYEKLSDEYLGCYNNHLKGVSNENDCINIEIPTREGNKCCFAQTSQLNSEGNIINNKRCYIIPEGYFTNGISLKKYLLDVSKIKNEDEIINTNITIKCKNYETFYFQGKIEHTTKSTSTSLSISSTSSSSTSLSSSSSSTSSSLTSNKTSGEESKSESSSGPSFKLRDVIIILVGFILISIVAILLILYCKKKGNNNPTGNKINGSNRIGASVGSTETIAA